MKYVLPSIILVLANLMMAEAFAEYCGGSKVIVNNQSSYAIEVRFETKQGAYFSPLATHFILDANSSKEWTLDKSHHTEHMGFIYLKSTTNDNKIGYVEYQFKDKPVDQYKCDLTSSNRDSDLLNIKDTSNDATRVLKIDVTTK